MVKRLITAAVGIPLGILILVLDNAHVVAAVVAFFVVAAVYEILKSTKFIEHKAVSAIGIIFSLIFFLLLCYDKNDTLLPFAGFAFVVAMMGSMLVNHKKVTFKEAAMVGFVALAIPVAFSTLALFKFEYPEHGIFLIVYTLGITWIADGGAYFAGTFLGKHKLCPQISPKKTWEGFFGGVISAGVFAAILGYGYMLWDYIFTGENSFTVNVIDLVAVALISSILAVIGDLSASLLKRQCDVKDFGNLLPGHGGIMDRFDSVLFVSPFIYLAFSIFFPFTQL